MTIKVSHQSIFSHPLTLTFLWVSICLYLAADELQTLFIAFLFTLIHYTFKQLSTLSFNSTNSTPQNVIQNELIELQRIRSQLMTQKWEQIRQTKLLSILVSKESLNEVDRLINQFNTKYMTVQCICERKRVVSELSIFKPYERNLNADMESIQNDLNDRVSSQIITPRKIYDKLAESIVYLKMYETSEDETEFDEECEEIEESIQFCASSDKLHVRKIGMDDNDVIADSDDELDRILCEWFA